MQGAPIIIIIIIMIIMIMIMIIMIMFMIIIIIIIINTRANGQYPVMLKKNKNQKKISVCGLLLSRYLKPFCAPVFV